MLAGLVEVDHAGRAIYPGQRRCLRRALPGALEQQRLDKLLHGDAEARGKIFSEAYGRLGQANALGPRLDMFRHDA